MLLISRTLSSVVALVYLIAAYADSGGGGILSCALFLILPLVCIWFSEAMGDFAGVIRLHQITAETPAWLVACGGWLLLLAPVIGSWLQHQVV